MLIRDKSSIFETSKCSCGTMSEIIITHLGTYRHRCPRCSSGWVVVGSPMDVANELIWSNLDQDKL